MRGTDKIKKLIQDIPNLEVKRSKEIEITGISSDSRKVAPGHLFVAKKGLTHDGNDYISDAVANGAVCVLTDMVDPFLQITQLIHPDVAFAEAKIAANFFHHPSKKLKVIGITGTNGKTTTSFLIKELLEKNEIKTGLIGTIDWIIGEHRFAASATTPDVITSHQLLRDMQEDGCRSAVMEVSSHGLSQNRVGEIEFSIALFTNFSRDHLDYHGSMEEYFAAKQLLFSNLREDKWAIYNADEKLDLKTKAKKFTYGIDGGELVASEIKLSDKGSRFTLCYKEEKVLCRTNLIGKFNIYNALAAISTALCMGISLEKAAAGIKSFKGAPGRLQRVKNNIFVDYAHTPDALENVLETLRTIKKGKIITVFGCGGDRDKGKREKMGAVVSRLSEIGIITNDNPRGENPEEIAKQILTGFSTEGYVELDRKKAIEKAIALAERDDIVLIAGKGHERSQIFAHQILPFDDVEIAKGILHCV